MFHVEKIFRERKPYSPTFLGFFLLSFCNPPTPNNIRKRQTATAAAVHTYMDPIMITCQHYPSVPATPPTQTTHHVSTRVSILLRTPNSSKPCLGTSPRFQYQSISRMHTISLHAHLSPNPAKKVAFEPLQRRERPFLFADHRR